MFGWRFVAELSLTLCRLMEVVLLEVSFPCSAARYGKLKLVGRKGPGRFRGFSDSWRGLPAYQNVVPYVQLATLVRPVHSCVFEKLAIVRNSCYHSVSQHDWLESVSAFT